MANTANVNRHATEWVFVTALDHLQACAGLMVQTHRAYCAPSIERRGKTQQQLATDAGTDRNRVGQLERGEANPADSALEDILSHAGFKMGVGESGRAFLSLLQAIRDSRSALQEVKADLPD